MSKTRIETDSHGAVHVPADKYWGAQTQRSLTFFSIGTEKMPIELICAYALLKKVVAKVNCDLGVLSIDLRDLIIKAADEILDRKLDGHFPLHVWMTGSGTQLNMNVNEVIANRACELAGKPLGSYDPINPNDHVNLSQSTNDSFPSAMHIAIVLETTRHLIPHVKALRDGLDKKAKAWHDIIKVGRTHLQDATPLTLGQEFSGYTHMLDESILRIQSSLNDIYPLALGGTAVGTGLNTYSGFSERSAAEIAQLTQLPFVSATNKFAVQGSHDALVAFSGSLRTLAVSLYKIASDIRLLACGPRCGIGELILPANEPGSSFMPGKVNPTQCEAMTMVAAHVMGNDVAVGIGGAGGALEMNGYKPLLINSILQSIRILGDSSKNFNQFLVTDMAPNTQHIQHHLDQSLMLVTALSPAIGYQRAAEVAHHAHDHRLSLKAACLSLGYLDEAAYDALINPAKMIKPKDKLD